MKLTYKDSGVDITKGYEEVSLIKEMVQKTHNSAVLTGLGGFAGLMSIDKDAYEEPILVSGTDGVGTKLLVAQAMGIHHTLGIDLVAMCVNDILCQGAKPLFFLDYIATGKLDPHKMSEIVAGVAEGCLQSGSALIGGETAEMPGLYDEHSYDLAGFSVGIVDRKNLITGQTIREGDYAIGLKSSGIHANGLSLARLAIEKSGFTYQDTLEGYDQPIGTVLLEPTKIYAQDVQALLAAVDVKGIAHITGGGLYENLPRILPKNLGLKIQRPLDTVPQIFKTIQQLGNVEWEEMYRTFNMGIGMVLVVEAESLSKAKSTLDSINSDYEVLGPITDQFHGVQVQW